MLKNLLIELNESGCPEDVKAVFLLDCPDTHEAPHDNVAEATYSLSNTVTEGKGVFVGSTAYLAESVSGLSREDIDNQFDKVCEMMDW